MKKITHYFKNYIINKNEWHFMLAFILFSSFSFAQTITPSKTATNSTANCGVIDVKLDITGTNPARRNSDVILVIDVSGSMNDIIPGDTKKPMQYAKEAAKSFITAASSNPLNRIAIVSYTTTAKLQIKLTSLTQTGIDSLNTQIDKLTSIDRTNIQDGIVKASTELNTNGRFDCNTARSIILLTDGITNRSGVNGGTICDNVSTTTACVTSAIQAATAAKTTVKNSINYSNQIFSIGLLGAISGDINTPNTDKYVAYQTLKGIQDSAPTIAYKGQDLNSIYNNIATQLTWVAQNLTEKETVPAGYTINNISSTKGTATQSTQNINWNIDFLNSETITLTYQLIPNSSICGNQIVSTSSLIYTNSNCKSDSKAITTPSTNIPCLALTLASKTDVSCFGTNNGTITLNDATGGTGPYTYDWSDLTGASDPKNRTDLASGTYTVIARDNKGCSTTPLEITITQPQAPINASAIIVNNNNCTNCSNGSIDLTLSGGTAPYTFLWSNQATTEDISNLTKGTYSVAITDKNGCKANYTYTITESSIKITKDGNYVDANQNGVSNVGDVVSYKFVITNTGNVILTNVNVTDNNAIITGGPIVSLAVGATDSTTFSGSHVITQEDIDIGYVYNLATATAKDPEDKTVTHTSSDPTPCTICPIKPDCPDCTITIIPPPAPPIIIANDDNAGTIVGVNQITPNVINVFTNDTLNGLPVNPLDVNLTTITSNPYLQLNPNGSIDVLPNAPVGTQTMTYQICQKIHPTNCDSAIVTVIIVAPSMTISGEAICINDVPYFSYTATANNFTPVNGLTLSWADSNNKVIATMTNLPLNGKVLWPGATIDQNGNGNDWPGWVFADGKWSENADGFEGLRPTANITFTLNPSQTITVNYPPSDPFCSSRPTFKIDAVDDTAGPIDGINGSTNILNVFNNDTLNTLAVNPNDVKLTLVTADPTGSITMNPDGSIDLKDGTPAGTYTLVYQICEIAHNGNCDSATVTIIVTCANSTKIDGIIFNAGTNTPLANVPVTLIPQNTTTGPTLIRITNSQGYYNFTGMVAGDYLVQVQDANLNGAYQLYPIASSLFFTTLEACKYKTHDFGYDKSVLPVLGDFVWYDINNNGIQDEWFDANNDNLITQNIPDANGSFDYSKWEWIDLNGDGSYEGPSNVGELNAAGFGNSKSSNIFVTGPNNYSDSVIIGIQGYWRNRPTEGVYGDYKVELKMDPNLEAQSSAMGATGLVKVIPNTNKNVNSTKTSKLNLEVCGPTNEDPQTATVTNTDPIHLDLDFGINCKIFDNIQATNDSYSITQCSILGEIRNALSNDLINGSPADITAFKFKLLTSLAPFIEIDENGNVAFADGVGTGQYSFDYQVCEATNPLNCSSATITINVTGIEPVTISSSTCNADTTPIDLSKLLPDGISTNGTWIDSDNTGGLVGNILNAVGIPVNRYKFEYKIGGNCPRSIFLTMDINDDCKVLPCKTIIIHNAVSSNDDGKNDYFQIENLENNECYKNFKVEIFNRWGVLVFEKENYNNEGNAFRGRSEGRTTINKNEGLPTGTYFYVVSYDTVDGVGKTENIKKDGYLYLVK